MKAVALLLMMLCLVATISPYAMLATAVPQPKPHRCCAKKGAATVPEKKGCGTTSCTVAPCCFPGFLAPAKTVLPPVPVIALPQAAATHPAGELAGYRTLPWHPPSVALCV